MSLRTLVIGQGSHLRRAVRILRESGYEVLIHLTDASSHRSPGPEVIVSSGNPNESAIYWPEWLKGSPIVAANNPFILNDSVLREFPHVYNIHVSNVHRNRGLGHLCLVHSLLIGDVATGVTSQRLTPGHPVDGSPTVSIREIPIKATDGFDRLMGKLSLGWESALREDILHAFREPSEYLAPKTLGPQVSLKLLNTMVFEEGAYNEALATQGLGNFSRFLPRTELALAEYREFWARNGMCPEPPWVL